MLCLGKVLQHPESNEAWKNRVAGARSEKSYRDYDAINGESTEFEWNIFPGFTTLQLCDKISDLLSSMGQTPETFTGRILFMSMFNDISCDRNGNKDECLKNANYVKTFAERFGIGQWSFIGPGSEKKWYSSENSPQGAWDHIAEEMLLRTSQKVDIPLSVQRLHCPGAILKRKGTWKTVFTLHCRCKTQLIQFIALFFLSISSVSTEQWQLYARNLRTIKIERVQPVILVGQSIVLGEVKAETPVHNEDPMNDPTIWQQYIQQVESLSPENRVSKFCKEAGFMRVVEAGQYFVTKDTSDFRQFNSVACREYTLPRDDSSFSTKRMDSRKYEDWTCIGSHDQFPALQVWN